MASFKSMQDIELRQQISSQNFDDSFMSFAYVLFGDGKSELVNTHCRNVSVLQSLRERCYEVCKLTDAIDVADESGKCKFLSRTPDEYAFSIINPRQRLVLLMVEEADENEDLVNQVRLRPLLNGAVENKEFMDCLNPTRKIVSTRQALPIAKSIKNKMFSLTAMVKESKSQAAQAQSVAASVSSVLRSTGSTTSPQSSSMNTSRRESGKYGSKDKLVH